ncbi:hypothetical protein ACH4TP_18535 [Streptomyces sp. NPDC021012]|uniref:hypothetical protein n=1 Tax=Streptomyces sp. NPDC021012 TaxID=3365107 RepID=UPI00378E755C
MPASENPALFSRLQVYEVVGPGEAADGGLCIVRCVGGTARVGQVFVLERDQDTAGPENTLVLDRIEKYRQPLESLDPPHSAAVLLSGGPLDRLRAGDVLVSHPAPDWHRKLEASGLRVLDLDRASHLPDVPRAHRAFAGYEVKPTVSVSRDLPDAAAELDRQWNSLTTSAHLTDPAGEFCMLAPGPGSHDIGWIRVKDPIGTNLPSRILAATGDPEFLTVSVDGQTMCAVSDEEYDHWIVMHHFSDEN